MKKVFSTLAITILYCSVAFAQVKPPIPKGLITITTNKKIKFTNLKYVDNQVVFTNAATKSEFTYFFNTIKSIEDGEGNIIYQKEGIVTSKDTIPTIDTKDELDYPELIPLIEDLKINDENILALLKKYDDK